MINYTKPAKPAAPKIDYTHKGRARYVTYTVPASQGSVVLQAGESINLNARTVTRKVG